jgi:hypothetical protein
MKSQPVLPQLRQELELIEGGTGVGGSPSRLIHDPVRNQYFQLDWVSFEMLRCWGKVAPEVLLDDVRERGRVHVSEADLSYLIQFLSRHQLLQVAQGASGQMAGRASSSVGRTRLLEPPSPIDPASTAPPLDARAFLASHSLSDSTRSFQTGFPRRSGNLSRWCTCFVFP